MRDFSSDIEKILAKKKKTASICQEKLQKWGLRDIKLRKYQLDGVKWLTQCLTNRQGCILGDEMGLGKTCQTISLLVYMSGALHDKGPFLILSPLSVLQNWRDELECFAPGLTVLCYEGHKQRRAELQREAKTQDFHVLLTTYELCMKDTSFLKRWTWKVIVVDEAHRLKNPNSVLHKVLFELSADFRVLLTGTPIQNNLQELYSLLTVVQPSIFTAEDTDYFVSTYANVKKQPDLVEKLQVILEPFLLRRIKSEVALDLPKKTEVVVYHGLSALQKKYYKAILMKDIEVFENEQVNKTRLLNILMQLRKCVDHPYLFDGVEPEPFEIGEHLVQASQKLFLLDRILAFLNQSGHRVLLFSQMTRMLDVIQDFMEYRGYSYERLDGSVRGEERNLAVKNFSNKDIFVFLLSTKAGGVGMNLTAADTVIFVDSDFNPHNDLQAAARCHRIGQNRPVKVIRLLARDTVEEIMYTRAISKLRLSNVVIEEGRFSVLEEAQSAAAGLQLSDILKFGIDKLLVLGESSVQNLDLEKILGPSRDGQWVAEKESDTKEEDDGSESEEESHMYYFEGKDYSKNPSTEDKQRFRNLLQERLTQLQQVVKEGSRSLRHKPGVSLSAGLVTPLRKRKQLSEAEVELRRQRREEAAAKRAKIQEELKKRQKEQEYKKKMELWKSCGYRSLCLQAADSEEDEDSDDEGSISSTDSSRTDIHYVLGDVTHPHVGQEDAIIVHCVDNSGWWGRGGLFSALKVRSDEPEKRYELAGRMKDLDLGNVLFFSIDDKQSRLDGKDHLALIVAQERDKGNKLSGILMSALNEGLKKIYAAAKKHRASVHLPRIGHSTAGFNWYGTERLIRKHLASRGIPTFIYYYRRSTKKTEKATPPPSISESSESQSDDSDVSSDSPQSATAGPSSALGNK